MIKLQDWKRENNFNSFNGCLNFIMTAIQSRKDNPLISKIDKDNCYYDNQQWHLSWYHKDISIEWFIYHILKLKIMYNVVNIENYYFHRCFDVIYRECIKHKLYNNSKIELIEYILKICDEPLKQNLKQYLDKEMLLKSFEEHL